MTKERNEGRPLHIPRKKTQNLKEILAILICTWSKKSLTLYWKQNCSNL